MHKTDCIFCQIALKKAPAHLIWEDEHHLAFLSIFPNTPGFTVVATKEHFPSYAFNQDDEVLSRLVLASKKVVRILDHYFPDVTRTGLFFEGYGVDHLHSKLFPMHGTAGERQWQNIESKTMRQFFEYYPGYLSSNDSNRADDRELAKLATAIRRSQQD